MLEFKTLTQTPFLCLLRIFAAVQRFRLNPKPNSNPKPYPKFKIKKKKD
jgi:hypothetical protein